MDVREVASRLHGVLVKVVSGSSRLDEMGSEVPDPKPLAPPLGYKRQPTMVEHIRELIRSERMAVAAQMEGKETLEESEDFEIDDDPADPLSGFESDYDPPMVELREAVKEARAAKAAQMAEDEEMKARAMDTRLIVPAERGPEVPAQAVPRKG